MNLIAFLLYTCYCHCYFDLFIDIYLHLTPQINFEIGNYYYYCFFLLIIDVF